MAELTLGVWQAPAELVGLDARLAWLEAQCEASEGTQLALLPELFLSGYFAGEEGIFDTAKRGTEALEAVAGLAVKHRVSLALGYPEHTGDALYNSACLIDAAGHHVLTHRKRVLPPGFEAGCFTLGSTSPDVVSVGGFKVALLICYEVEFPEAVRACALAGADLVLVPTALVSEWAVVAQHVIPARAFENTVYVAYANHVGREGDGHFLGQSCIVSADGLELARAGASAERLTARLDTSQLAAARARLPFLEECRRF